MKHIVIDVHDPGTHALWEAVAELAGRLPADWVLVGGLMVQLHALERGVRDIRVTADIDVLGQARPQGALESIDAVLAADGFTGSTRATGAAATRTVWCGDRFGLLRVVRGLTGAVGSGGSATGCDRGGVGAGFCALLASPCLGAGLGVRATAPAEVAASVSARYATVRLRLGPWEAGSSSTGGVLVRRGNWPVAS